MEDKQSFGRYIREKRTNLNLSQRELAEKLFVTESAVSKWERGVSYPDITLVTPLCETLGISEHELVTAGDDWRQRKLEAEASTYRKVRLAWLWGVAALYVLVVAGVARSALAGASEPVDVAVAAAACLMCASVTHVPVLARKERPASTLLAFFASLNLCVAAGLASSNPDGWQADFGVAFVALLFTLVLLAGPFLLTWACRRVSAPRAEEATAAILHHRALICLTADTVLLLCLVVAATAHGGAATAYVAQMVAIAGVLMIPAWTTFLALRYLPAVLPFRLAAAFAAAGMWLFLVGGIVNLVMGLPFDWHAAVNFADWTSYPAVNDNLCWLILGACLVVAGTLCLAGVFSKQR